MKHTELAGPLMVQPVMEDDEGTTRRIVLEPGPYERYSIVMKRDMCEKLANDLLMDADELTARLIDEQNSLAAAQKLGLAAEHRANGSS